MLVNEKEVLAVELSEQERNYIYSCLFSEEIVKKESNSLIAFFKNILAKIF